MHHFYDAQRDSILGNLIAALIFAVTVYLIQVFRSLVYFRWRFNKTEFNIYLKGEDHIHVRTAKITVRWQDIFGIRPVMRVYSEQIPSRQKPDPFKGEFVFNPLNIRYGKGFLYHEDHRFNFPEIMIKDRDTFYTQSLFLAHRKGAGPTEFEEHPIAFVWQRIKSK